ncbi:amidase [Pseudactinotalea sp.]|uniref:amidase n=1 Tax=Pseudactinotalea sp. TaxID=1926260 RepID=UPI003B3AFC74
MSMEVQEYLSSGGVELGARVAAGEVAALDLAETALSIAEAAEPHVNAYARLYQDRAREQAAERDEEVRAGRIRGPLHGVPVAIKDNMAYEGTPMLKGSWTTTEEPQTTSAPMVERLLEAGAVIVGATTTPEFGWKGTGISPRTGISRNPWDTDRGTGGSSAGAGATVATGAVPIATGTDAGGSVRIPASFCGVVGVKPTLGAIPVWPGTVNENLSHAGVLTRSVADALAALRITRGPDPRDPQSFHSWPPQPSSGTRFRVGVVARPFGIGPSPEVAQVWESALAAIVAADVADLENVDITAALPREVFEALWVTGRGLGFADLVPEWGDRMDPALVRVTELARDWSLADYYRAMGRRRAFNASMAQMLSEWDALLMPTMPITALAAEAEVPEHGELDAGLPWITWTPYTYPFNITGQPAISLPTGLGVGMPVGVQIVSGWGRDEDLMALALQVEGALASTNALRVASHTWTT